MVGKRVSWLFEVPVEDEEGLSHGFAWFEGRVVCKKGESKYIVKFDDGGGITLEVRNESWLRGFPFCSAVSLFFQRRDSCLVGTRKMRSVMLTQFGSFRMAAPRPQASRAKVCVPFHCEAPAESGHLLTLCLLLFLQIPSSSSTAA